MATRLRLDLQRPSARERFSASAETKLVQVNRGGEKCRTQKRQSGKDHWSG